MQRRCDINVLAGRARQQQEVPNMAIGEASLATRRFGLGPRPGDLKRIAGDPRGYVLASLAKPDAALLSAPNLQSTSTNLTAWQEANFAEQVARAMAPPPVPPEIKPADTKAADAKAPATPALPPRRDVFVEEAAARLERAAITDAPFVERLVLFWSNHFSISAAKGGNVRVMTGSFEREAIRPYVLGRFADMLLAVEQHPAMLFYLDNAQSIGPNSPAGFNRGRGLNENLAREILELHTLGVDGGYSQADVTSFARVLTGWTVTDQRMILGKNREIKLGEFAFMPQRHEPGEQTVLAKIYPDRGVETGEAVLADLAKHPATARHIARKLVAHFVSEKQPPPALVARLEKAFRDTGGDLAAVAKALASAPECWQTPPRKVVPPYDFTVSLMRAFDMKYNQVEALRVAAAIGQPLWQPPSPKGWPDEDDAWMGPSAVRERLRIAERIARLANNAKLDPRVTADDLLGPSMSEQSRQAIARAEAREQGLELLIMSPDFLRR